MKLTTWLTPWPGLVGMHVSVSESEAFAKKDNMSTISSCHLGLSKLHKSN